ncbi:hypothetical protein ACFQV2_23450 [Actinokineospora soli]|uniref:Uncharacterized protein n=1 Tax=Actinokineospora soli TaxID=1048753 RepID=A0ABW2TT54_9PSEU
MRARRFIAALAVAAASILGGLATASAAHAADTPGMTHDVAPEMTHD